MKPSRIRWLIYAHLAIAAMDGFILWYESAWRPWLRPVSDAVIEVAILGAVLLPVIPLLLLGVIVYAACRRAVTPDQAASMMLAELAITLFHLFAILPLV